MAGANRGRRRDPGGARVRPAHTPPEQIGASHGGRGVMVDLSSHVEEQSTSGSGRMSFDLALFVELNEEYRSKPLRPTSPPITDALARRRYKTRVATNVARYLAPHKDLGGARLLDFGCGRGDLAIALAEELGCDVLGVDVHEYPEWEEITHPRVKLRRVDLSDASSRAGLRGAFDAIVSISVLEHVRRPFEALEGLREVLRPDGVAYLKANLYRGPLASHRYRDVYFPWPHLLFHDDVFRQYAERTGQEYEGAAWVNRLTHLHYFDYFERIGWKVIKESYSVTPIDESFYARFHDILARYPREDLERDFLNVIIAPQRRLPQRRDFLTQAGKRVLQTGRSLRRRLRRSGR